VKVIGLEHHSLGGMDEGHGADVVLLVLTSENGLQCRRPGQPG
jgi:hypothetical protein